MLRRFKLKERESIEEEEIRKIYEKVEDINDDDYEALEFPAVVFYTNIKSRKWSKEKEWDDILVYGKKFSVGSEEKYLKFKDLVGNYTGTSRERFPKRPSELDVKNLFYVWVSDFCDETQIMDAIRDEIKRFGEIFVDLDKWEPHQ